MEFTTLFYKINNLLGNFFLICILAVKAEGAGYEKPDLISARHQALGGAVISIVNDARSLYFNPAGLAEQNFEGDHELAGDVSPFVADIHAPFLTGTASQQNLTAKSELHLLFGAFFKKSQTEELGYGFGLYTMAGSGANYGRLNTGQAVDPEFNVQVGAMEFAGGLGYQLTDTLRLGAALRISLLKGSLKTLPTPATSLSIEDLTGVSTSGLKIGLQYIPVDANWTAGLVYRTKVDWSLTGGQVTLTDLTTGISTPPADDGEIATSLPEQYSIGFSFNILDNSKFLFQYDFTEYSAVDMRISGTMGSTLVNSVSSQNFSDQHTIRVGFEKTSVSDWSFRSGIIINNSVTNSDTASPFSLPPAPEYVVAVGTGKQISRSITGDVAFSYLKGGGDGKATAGGLNDGHYSTTMSTLHTSLKYVF